MLLLIISDFNLYMASLKNIRNILSEITWSLGLMCKSNKINKWSFRKPINSDKVTKLTDSELYDINDGFRLYTFNTPQRMLYELQHENASNIWEYIERTEPYRLGDFDDYNHSATRLCNFSIENNNSGSANTNIRFYCSDILDMIQHWKYFEGVRSYVDFVFLIYEYGKEYNASGSQGVYVYKIKSIADYDGDGNFNLRIPSLLSQGQYEIRLCCSTATSGLSDGECVLITDDSNLNGLWYALPHHTKNVISVVSSGGGGESGGTDYFNYVDISFPRSSYDYANNTISNLSFTNYVAITACEYEINYYADYYYDNVVGGVIRIGSAQRTLSEVDMPWATININYNNSINTVSDANLDDGISIRAEIYITINGSTQHKSITQRVSKF